MKTVVWTENRSRYEISASLVGGRKEYAVKKTGGKFSPGEDVQHKGSDLVVEVGLPLVLGIEKRIVLKTSKVVSIIPG